MGRCIVILTVAFATLWVGTGAGQTPRSVKNDKGPRATGLLQLAANGKAYLVPITIMIDGHFYDAGAYKASPVPMALATETVYEAVQTGVPQGLFTVTAALKRLDGWVGEGRWRSQAEIEAAEAKQKATTAAAAAKKKDNETHADKPPTLRRGGANKPSADTQTGAPSATTTPAATPGAAPAAPQQPPSSTAAGAKAGTSPDENDKDKDRPTLRRGKPAARNDNVSTESPPAKSAVAGSSEKSLSKLASTSAIQFVPAISDAAGPDMRPYKMNFSATEEAELRKKMLAMAADEVRARAALLAANLAPPPASAPKQLRKAAKAAKLPQPTFEQVQFRAFDLSNSNEPVLILTAEARMPKPVLKAARDPQREDPSEEGLRYSITLVARNDIYGELHKALSNVTDVRHLDALPRLELIDAVDVDGDGRGELLFRQISNAGNAFVVYRVIGYQLWPLFQGAFQGMAGSTAGL